MIEKAPSIQALIEGELIAAPSVTAYNQALQMAAWCHKLRQWSSPQPKPPQTIQRQHYFPQLPTTGFTRDNILQSPQRPLLFLGDANIRKQVTAVASGKIQFDEEGVAHTPMPLPAADKTFYLAEHIEVATGELAFANLSFTLPGPLGFAWTCRYRSSISEDFGLGPGWMHPLCERLLFQGPSEETSETSIYYLSGDGRYIQFAQPAIGEACINRSEGMVLERLGTMNYRLMGSDTPDRLFRTDGTNPWLPLSEIRDSADNTLSIDYQDGMARKIVSSWGRVVEIHYQDQRIVQIKSSSAEADSLPLATYVYTDAGLLARAYNEQGLCEHYAYDNERLSQRILPSGEPFTFAWQDAQQRYLGVTQGELVHRYKWRSTLRCADINNSEGDHCRAQFDAANRLIQFTDAEGYLSQWFYDSYGNLCSHTDPLGSTEYYRWDQCGRCIRHTNTLGVSTYYRYDKKGNAVHIENSAGQIWQRDYNANGQLLAERDPLGNTWRFSYSQRNMLAQIEDPEGAKTQLKWNSLAELEQVTTQEGRVTQLAYTSAGKLLRVWQENHSLIEYGYDKRNRPEVMHLLHGEQWKIKYDDANRILAMGLPGGFAAAYEYDTLGRCKLVKFNRGERWEYLFDTAGRCVEVRGNTGSELRSYNRLGWLVALESPGGRRQRFAYNAAGQLVQHRDTALVVHIERDARGQPVKITNNSGESYLYRYDELSRLVLAENHWGTLRFQYDLCGKLVAEHQEFELLGSRSFLHSYDKRGWHQKTNSDEHHIGFALTPDGLLRGIDINAQGIFRCDFNELGLETEWVHNELKTQLVRENQQFKGIHTKVGHEQKTVFQQQFEGRQRSGIHHLLDRAITAKAPEQGNLDERCNVVQGANYTYNYDGWNNLITAESGDFKTYFRYDAFARRIAKITTHRKSKNVRQSLFYWLGNKLWNEIHKTPKGEDCFYYLRHPYHGALLAFIANTKPYYYLNTPSLHPLALLNARGETLWHASYDGAGQYQGLEKASKINSPWRGHDAYFDIETQLYFVAGSYYSPELKCFLQQTRAEHINN